MNAHTQIYDFEEISLHEESESSFIYRFQYKSIPCFVEVHPNPTSAELLDRLIAFAKDFEQPYDLRG